MLGYVKCEPGEMLVKHHSLYRAAYCGLCRSVKRNTTRFLLPFFSDDWVFLAVIRMAVSGEEIKTEKDFCLLHPFRKDHRRIADNASLRYAAVTSLIFTYEKMRDDLTDRDSSFFRRLLIRAWAPLLSRRIRRLCKEDPDLYEFSRRIAALLAEERELEEKNADLDAMCSHFASCLSLAFSYGLAGEEERLLGAIGDRVGRFLYTLDALDDLEKDGENGAFNPILRRFSSVEEAKGHFPEIDLVLAFYVQEAKSALDLVSGEKNMLAVCDNIISHGLPGAVRRILKPKMEKTNERSL